MRVPAFKNCGVINKITVNKSNNKKTPVIITEDFLDFYSL